MSPPSPALPPSFPTWPLRLGLHHFAHLRAVAEGLPVAESAARYLGIEHGHQAQGVHRAVVERLRSLARRQGERAWRLLGLVIAEPAQAERPSLQDFIEQRELDGWREEEVLALYGEAFPADAKAERRRRLRSRQRALLRALEQVAVEIPQSSDRIDGWLEPRLAARLQAAGLLLMGELVARIARGGRWWQGIAAMGRTKGQRLEAALRLMMPEAPGWTVLALPWRPDSPAQQAVAGAQPGPGGNQALEPATAAPARVATVTAAAALPAGRLTDASDDAAIIHAWVAARAGSVTTARCYRREALRLLLWLDEERHKGLAAMAVDDCLAYMAFLQHLPPRWMSRRHACVLGAGWAPFKGPLSPASQRQAVNILGSFFSWMVDVGYLPGRNPWALVNRRSGDAPGTDLLDSRAFTPAAWAAILAHIEGCAPSASRQRMLFVLRFVEATGLRASELLHARLGALRYHNGRLAMQVRGKGAKERVIAVPGQAEQALVDYLRARGLPPLGQVPADTPLLASTTDPQAAIGYQALYQTVKRWITRAVQASALSPAEREVALRASPHWLRHTFGTRALERKAPLEVVQRQLGHADPRTTMRYARTQLERLQAEMDAAFGGR